MSTTQTLQEKLAAAKLANAQKAANPEQAAEDAAAKVKEQEEVLYQQYKCSRPSTRIITDKGIRVSFVGFELLTIDEDVIEYLDAQIAVHGLPGITKGEQLSLSDRDPMATMRRTLKEELLKEIAEEAAAKARGESRNMGSTEAKATMVIAGTDKVAN